MEINDAIKAALKAYDKANNPGPIQSIINSLNDICYQLEKIQEILDDK